MALPSLIGGWGGPPRPNPFLGQLGSPQPNAAASYHTPPSQPAMPSLTGGFGGPVTSSPFAGQLGRPQRATTSPYTPPAASHTLPSTQVGYEAQPAVSQPPVKPSVPAAPAPATSPAATPVPALPYGPKPGQSYWDHLTEQIKDMPMPPESGNGNTAMPRTITPQPRVPYVPANPAGPAQATPAAAPDALAKAAGNQASLNPFLSSMGFQAGNPDFNRRQSAMMAKQVRNWGGPQNLLAAMSVGGNQVYGMDRNQMQRQLGDRQYNVQRELGLGDQDVRRYISDNTLTGVRHTSDNALEGTKYTADTGLQGVQDTNAMQRDRTAANERTAAGNQATTRYGYDAQGQTARGELGLKERELAMKEQEAAARREGAVPARDRAKFEFYQSQAETARTPAERQRYQQLAEQILSPGAAGVQAPTGTAMDSMPFDARQQIQTMVASGAPASQMQRMMIAAGMDSRQIEAVLRQVNPNATFQPSMRNPGGSLGGEMQPRSMTEALGMGAGMMFPFTAPFSVLPQMQRMYGNLQ